MERRQAAQSTVLVADDWATVWRCKCGYDNAGREKCLVCGSPAPAEAQQTAGLHAESEVLPDKGPRTAATADRKALRTAFGIIALNLLWQGLTYAFLRSADLEPAAAIRLSLYSGVVFFAVIALWAMGRAAVLGVQPVLGKAKALVGAAEGFAVGGATAVFLVALVRIVAGRPLVDPTMGYLATEGSIVGLVIGLFVTVVAAPVVEELIFRGFLAEAIYARHRKKVAVVVSAAAFSLAHLRLAQFRYFWILGVGLALIYFRRGLVGSIAAHATFNGLLMVFAFAATHAPAVQVTAAGSTLEIPPTYQVIRGDAVYEDLYVIGPLGARVGILHADADVVPNADQMAQLLASGAIPLPEGVTLDAVVVTTLDLPAGRAASLVAELDGRQGRLVALPVEGRIWMAIFESDGTSRSSFQFDDMLRSWRLPGQLVAS